MGSGRTARRRLCLYGLDDPRRAQCVHARRGQGRRARSDDETLSKGGRWVVAGLALVAMVLLAASAYGIDLGLPTLLAAIIVSAAVCIRTRRNPLPLARAISWSTLGLVAGLFVMVDAIESVGALTTTQHWLAGAASLPAPAAAFVTSSPLALPTTSSTIFLWVSLPEPLRGGNPGALVTHCILIGVDLGPNLSVTGSLATILWLLAIRKEGLNVSFFDFLKIGAIVMPVALIASVGGVLIMHALSSL